MMNIPTYTFVANSTIDGTWLKNIIINMNDPSDHATINAIATQIQISVPNATINKTYEQEKSTSKIKKILDKVFYGLISVTMFLCFFSLCASMSANLY